MRGILPHLPLRVSNRETIEKNQKVPIERTYDDERRPELVKPENMATPYISREGKQAVRRAYGCAGMRGWKKQTPPCSGVDRG